MFMFKKVLPALVSISFLAVLMAPTMTLAVVQNLPEAGITTVEGLLEKINTIVSYVFTFVLAVAAIFVMYAGYEFMTAAGDETKIKKARTFLINALIGIAIAIGVKGLMMVIGNLLGVDLTGLDF